MCAGRKFSHLTKNQKFFCLQIELFADLCYIHPVVLRMGYFFLFSSAECVYEDQVTVGFLPAAGEILLQDIAVPAGVLEDIEEISGMEKDNVKEALRCKSSGRTAVLHAGLSASERLLHAAKVFFDWGGDGLFYGSDRRMGGGEL